VRGQKAKLRCHYLPERGDIEERWDYYSAEYCEMHLVISRGPGRSLKGH